MAPKGWDPEPRELPDEKYEELAESKEAEYKGKGGKKRTLKWDEKHAIWLTAHEIRLALSEEDIRELEQKLGAAAAKKHPHEGEEWFEKYHRNRYEHRKAFIRLLRKELRRY